MEDSPSKTVGQRVTPSSSRSGNSDTRQQRPPRRRSVRSSNEASEWRIPAWFRERLLLMRQQIQEGFHILHHEVRQPVTPSSSSSGNSDTRQQRLVAAEASEWRIPAWFKERLLLMRQQIQEGLQILHHEDSDETPVKRSSSFEFLPPNISELRVVLLGSSWSERSSVGNFILGETKFNTEEEPDHSLRVRGRLKKKEIVLINTPDLLRSRIFHHRLHDTCKSLSDPGPHVFLILIQPEDFTSVDELKLCRFLELFSDQSFDHSLVLISTPREESSGFMERYIQDPAIKEMIRKCKYRFLWRKNLEHPQLLTRLGQVVKENNGEPVH